jgi:hypothetical protein
MKKTYRLSQKKDVLGYRIGGLQMHQYGMPYRNAAGHIFPNDVDLLDLMFMAVETHPELHVITVLKDGRTLNRYESENANVHYLYTGNADPEIEFTTEYRLDDWTSEEREESRKYFENFRNREFSPIEAAAVNFAINAVLNKPSKV